jgi:hypothetical protein
MTEHTFRVRKYQRAFHEAWITGKKDRLIEIAHRRWGKDEIALNVACAKALQRPASYWHALPEYAQARKAIWSAVNPHTGKRRIDEAFPREVRGATNEQEMLIKLRNGATWQIVGSDRYNALVGAGVAGVTFSEWALCNPSAWGYIRPMLEENGGWAAFITTPRGNNHAKAMYDMAKANPRWFAEVSHIGDTGALSEEALGESLREYQALYGIDFGLAMFEQEYWCSFSGAMVGAYFGAEMAKAERDGRMCVVEINDKYPVHTAWDLGATQNNPIWCFQVIGQQLRIVDFYLPDSDNIEDWCAWLKAQGYTGNDYVPHDIMVTEWGSGKTRIETLRQLGRKPRRSPRVSVADGLQAARVAINSAVFHTGADARAERMAHGVDGVKSYRREWDDELKTFRLTPVKDWSEHIGSAWRYVGLSWREEVTAAPPPKPDVLTYMAMPDGTIQGNLDVRAAVEAMVKRRGARK